MKRQTYSVENLIELRTLAEQLAQRVIGSKETAPRVILLLDGPMGSGKTQFTKYFVDTLGAGQFACSPTFAIHNSYSTSFGAVNHFDLFRLESADDLESTGFWDFFREPSGIQIIEWAEKLRELGFEGAFPPEWKVIHLEFSMPDRNTNRRIATLTARPTD